MRRRNQGLRRLWAVSSVREMYASGIDWAPELPKSWRIVRAKYLLKKLNRQFAAEDTPLICTNKGEVTVRDDNSAGLVSSDEMNYQGVKEGDLLIHGMDTWHGAIAISKHSGKCTTVVHVCDSKQDKRYLCYFYRALAFQSVYKLISNGIRQNTSDFRSFPKFGVIPTFVPPLSEQHRIAEYLDERCGAIDTAKKTIEDEVGALQRLRAAEIHRATTKGLDASVSLRDSGAHFIGFIPGTWEIIRFRYLCDISTGDHDTQDREPAGKYPMYVRSPIVEQSNTYTFDGEGILMAGDGAGAGRVFHHAFGKYAVHQRVYCFHDFRDSINTDYLYYYLSNHFGKRMDMGSAQSTVPSVRLHMIKDFPIPLPSYDEQRQIVNYLDERCAAIDSVIDARTRQLERLEDYRKVLIYAYATGKKEVPAS